MFFDKIVDYLTYNACKIKSLLKKHKINIEETDITKDNIYDYFTKTIKLYNKGYYEDALFGIKKLSEYSREFKTIFVPHIEKCNHIINKTLNKEDFLHYKNLEILKHFGWIDNIKYLTGFISVVFLSPLLDSLFPDEEITGIPFSVVLSEYQGFLILGIFLAILTYMIHSRMQKFTKSQGLVRCKYCGHYTEWIDPNEPTFGFTNSNNCEQCGRMYPIPSFYWDSWEGLEYIKTRRSVPEQEFYDKYDKFKVKYKTEYNEWLNSAENHDNNKFCEIDKGG